PCSNCPMPNIREAPAYRSWRPPPSCLAANFQHDLTNMIAGFHPFVRGSRLGERKNAVDHRLQPAAFDVRPDGSGNLVGNHRLELDPPRPKRRSGQRQPPTHEVENLDFGGRSALDG